MGNGVSTEVKRKATKAIAAAKLMGALAREFNGCCLLLLLLLLLICQDNYKRPSQVA